MNCSFNTFQILSNCLSTSWVDKLKLLWQDAGPLHTWEAPWRSQGKAYLPGHDSWICVVHKEIVQMCFCVWVSVHICVYDCWYRIPVCGMQLHHSLLQLFTLIGCKNDFTDIVVLVEIWVVISKCWLNCVWTQQSQDVWWTGQSPNKNIFPQLKTQEISERITWSSKCSVNTERKTCTNVSTQL